MEKILQQALEHGKKYTHLGKSAGYIPELQKVPSTDLGIYIETLEGDTYGVGGGILATVPNKLGIGVYGPALDEKGNSTGGIKVLSYLSDALELSIF